MIKKTFKKISEKIRWNILWYRYTRRHTKNNHRLTEELENVILKGMSVDIKDRYQSMEEFCEALYGAVNERLGF